MHILITDSGVGGLSVCAFVERYLRTHCPDERVKLTYVNASPENDFGYNAMGSRAEKITYFDRFLRIITDRWQPDSIYIACNTLSVLLHETKYEKEATIPVKGIVETGVHLLLQELSAMPESVAAIFGTVTTIEAGTYARRLEEAGIDSTRIVNQACPGLADFISEDRGGERAGAEIRRWVGEALGKLDSRPEACLAYMACTHYGYRRELFAKAFEERGVRAEILNPNERAVDDLFGEESFPAREGACEIEVEVFSRYRIPDTALETLTFFLEGISPRTVEALHEFTHDPDMF